MQFYLKLRLVGQRRPALSNLEPMSQRIGIGL